MFLYSNENIIFFLTSPSYFTAARNTTAHSHNQAISCHWKPRPLNTEFTVKLIHQSIKSVYYSTKSIKSVNLHNKINKFSIKISKLRWTECRPSANKISIATSDGKDKGWRFYSKGRERERDFGLVEVESVSEEKKRI